MIAKTVKLGRTKSTLFFISISLPSGDHFFRLFDQIAGRYGV